MLTASQIFSAQVPRYTSYPTAPHFHPGITGRTYREWLERLPADAPVSLYLHVPFCDTLCWFCACHTTVVNNYSPVRDYVELLLTEIAAVTAILGRRQPVNHIHFGGGSPTLLSDGDMRRLMDRLREGFAVGASAEVAIEIDPRGFTEQHARTLAACGVTRASIGLQDCDPKVQQAINRLQSPQELRDCVDRLRGNGISRLNLDLVYGLPHQTADGLKRNLDLAVELAPGRMAIFGYAHVPSFKKHQALIAESALPDTEARLMLARQAERHLAASGYDAIGLDHFARPDDELAKAARAGTLRRNFQGYTTDTAVALLGFGASSISALPQGYVQNIATTTSYRTAICSRFLPVAKGIALTDDDRLRRHVIEQVMCYLKIDLGAACLRHGREVRALDWALPLLGDLVAAGAVTLDGRVIRVSPDQRPAARLVSAIFDDYLGRGTARHSRSA